jgi:hypothetical protein
MPSREWSLERLVNASTTGSQANSKVAALAGGGFVVVWEDGGSTAPIRAQRFDTAGNPVGDEIAIDTGLNEVLPSVADLADGGSAVTWTEDHTGNNYILGKLYSASGAVEHNQPVVFSFGPRRRLGRGVARRRIGGRSGPPECHRHRRQHRHCQQPHRRPAERANQATSCYDADGSAAASRQLFATLTNHASLTATDIYFVA